MRSGKPPIGETASVRPPAAPTRVDSAVPRGLHALSLDEDVRSETTTLDMGVMGTRDSHYDILFGKYGKFVFDAEEALEKLNTGVAALDLCCRSGAISGVSLLPADRRVEDFQIFESREVYYPIILNKGVRVRICGYGRVIEFVRMCSV